MLTESGFLQNALLQFLFKREGIRADDFIFFLSNTWENKQLLLFDFPHLTEESEM